MNAILIKQLSYKYPSNNYYSLHDITLNIQAKRCTGIIGPNGSGKSTLISALCGLLPNFSGSISYQGMTGALLDCVKQKVALVPQEYAFYPQLSVLQNLNYFLSLCAIDKQKRSPLINDILTQCELVAVKHQKAKKLSGGYKRRLNIAIALVKDPDVLFLDEPTVGIDPESRAIIIKLLEQFKKQGKTLLFTSHMLDEVERICDDIIVLRDGKGSMHQQTEQNNILLNVQFSVPPHNDELMKRYEKITEQKYQIQLDDQSELSAQLQFLTNIDIPIVNMHYSSNSIEQLYHLDEDSK